MNKFIPLWEHSLTEARHRGVSALRVTGMLFAMMLLFAGVLLWMSTGMRVGKDTLFAFAFPSAILVLYWWYTFVSSMASVCSPINQQLTPGLERRVAGATILLWIMLSMLLATFFANPYVFCAVVWVVAAGMIQPSRRVRTALFQVAWLWTAYGLASVFLQMRFSTKPTLGWENVEILIALCAVTGGMLGLAGLVRLLPVVSTIFLVAWVSSMSFSAQLFGMTFTELLYLIYGMSSQFLTHVGIALLLVALTLFGLLGFKGDMRFKQRQRAWRAQAVFGTHWDYLRGPGSQWSKFSGYGPLLNLTLRQIAGAQKRQRLLGFCLGPGGHWTGMLWISVMWCTMFVLFPTFMPSRNNGELVAALIAMFPVAFASFQAQLGRSIFRTRNEQQMLLLSPGWPSDQLIKSGVKSIVFRYTLSCLLSCGIGVLVAGWAYDLPFSAYSQSLSAILLSSILMFGHALRDYSQLNSAQISGKFAMFAIAMGPYLVLQITKIKRGPIELVALVAGVCCYVYLVWRFIQFAKATRVLPAAMFAKL